MLTNAFAVGRLSKPSLSIQHPLPGHGDIAPSASLAYPAENSDEANSFTLSPLLLLPPAFGSAYVGETFSCTLCANNELAGDGADTKKITGVRIEAEMKTPGATIALDLTPETASADEGDLAPGQSLQRIVSYHLLQEGNHVLSVTVKYTESSAQSGRSRTFRKLYQFVAKPCMVVRTKTGAVPSIGAGGEKTGRKKRWTLEAQLENCGEESICLDDVILETTEGLKSTGLNWHIENGGAATEKPILNAKDVQQICFLVEQTAEKLEDMKAAGDGRLTIGQLNIAWRSALGNKGVLSTGWLATKTV